MSDSHSAAQPVVPDLKQILQNDIGVLHQHASISEVGGWQTLLTPHLRTLLSASGTFSTEQTEQHCHFFDQHVVPWLGKSPSMNFTDGRLRREGPVSRLTKDGTPLEFSYGWKPSAKGSDVGAVRYVVDIAAHQPGSVRSKSLERALVALDAYNALATSQRQSLEIFAFWDTSYAVTNLMLQFDKLKHSNIPCSSCSASGMYLGFELQGSKVMLKPYWLLPTCATVTELLQLIDDVIRTCEPLDDFYRSEKFTVPWSNIKRHILTEDPLSRLHPCMISIDATKAPAQRFKLYTRCVFQGSTKFADWAHHLNAPGSIPPNPSYIKTFGDIWESLCTPDVCWSDEERQTQPNFAWVQFELHPTADVQSKVDIMCPEIPRPDNYISRTLLDHCECLKNAKFVRSLASTEEPTDFVTVIAIKPAGPMSEVVVYFTPAIFARTEWKSRYKPNGYFSKVRNRSYAVGLNGSVADSHADAKKF